MSNAIRFSTPTGHSIAFGQPTEDYVDIKLMALSTGEYTDMQGIRVKIDANTLDKIKERYDKDIREEYANEKLFNPDIAGLEAFDNRQAPNQLGHNDQNPNGSRLAGANNKPRGSLSLQK